MFLYSTKDWARINGHVVTFAALGLLFLGSLYFFVATAMADRAYFANQQIKQLTSGGFNQ